MEHTDLNTIQFLPLVPLQADYETQRSNERRFNSDKHVDNCFLCARPLTEKARDNGWMVHLHVQLGLIPNGADIDDMSGSQGCFPVGSECAKKIPAAYRFKF